ncbi:Ketosteroid isomerase-related protein [Phaeobacter piscinae]|uniref:Ketosteroid isomerase-related protein n=1 Tax=Phaeobacter piscinae TaxID=1580596 RepID=A0ABM6PG39_9RHOB|nr:nuclear transport factor 2 family protein [Phaeobacter piscinae]ATG36751.1 Ketosteroid isomerase-related protein [Phaeobacter piscinae]AUQ87272.1 Ketosteroid isomerase-related protein [Phaeobacter piscinae]AUR25155.1 Ketosteroid isomerase-related protein [Phaeobacter piscinae]
MQISAKETTLHTALIEGLYSAVDAMNAEAVASFLTDDVTFRLGNFDAITGRKAVEDANASFFATIRAMGHTITGIWISGNAVFCEGEVHYTRTDQSEHKVPFATRLGLRDDKIATYNVYADISGL